MNHRQHDDIRRRVLSGSDIAFAPRKTYALVRSYQPHRVGLMIEFERAANHEQQTRHIITRKGDAFVRSERQTGKMAVGRIADTPKRGRERRTTTTIRRTSLSQSRLLEPRFVLKIHENSILFSNILSQIYEEKLTIGYFSPLFRIETVLSDAPGRHFSPAKSSDEKEEKPKRSAQHPALPFSEYRQVCMRPGTHFRRREAGKRR